MVPPKGALMNADLRGITVPGDHTAVAVGAIGTPYPVSELIEELNEKKWNLGNGPSISSNTPDVQLNGAASANNHCWAVGFFHDTYVSRNLVLAKSGTVWQIIPCPNEGDVTVVNGITEVNEVENKLTSISAVTVKDIWAVGVYGLADDITNHPTAFHWDGAAWTSIPIDAPTNSVGDVNSVLNSISMVEHDDGWAVGYGWDYFLDPLTGTSVGYKRELFEHWNGKKWELVLGSDSHKISRQLNGVSSINKDDAWAVGATYDSANRIHSLIQHWDGTHWKVDQFSVRDFTLNGVYAVSSDDVWAVGTCVAGGAGGLTLHWDGVRWRRIPNAYGSIPHCSLNAISGNSSNNIWAVGSIWGNTIAQLWDGTKWKGYQTE
ncbi:MAG TPA: hypothetical protein VMW38_25460 [Terriglobia bacterium]|nr:hypothetical protein [Terriglobia bacterium]